MYVNLYLLTFEQSKGLNLSLKLCVNGFKLEKSRLYGLVVLENDFSPHRTAAILNDKLLMLQSLSFAFPTIATLSDFH